MIDQTPPEIMTTEERLAEVASIMADACERLRNKAGKRSLSAYFTGLQRQAKRPWQPQNERETQ